MKLSDGDPFNGLRDGSFTPFLTFHIHGLVKPLSELNLLEAFLHFLQPFQAPSPWLNGLHLFLLEILTTSITRAGVWGEFAAVSPYCEVSFHSKVEKVSTKFRDRLLVYLRSLGM